MNDLINLFGVVASGFRARLRHQPALDDLRLAPFPARLLALIGRYPGCSQQQLASWTGRDKAQVARAIKELEQRSLIGRTTHPTDWRTQSTSLKPEGQAAFELLERQRSESGASVLECLDASERDLLWRLLIKLQNKLSQT